MKNYKKKLEMEKLAFAQKIMFSLGNDQATINIPHYSFISKADHNQTYIAIIMSMFSLLEHSFNIVWYVLNFFNSFYLANGFLYAALLSVVLKLIGNLFILRKFNSLFSIELKKKF